MSIFFRGLGEITFWTEAPLLFVFRDVVINLVKTKVILVTLSKKKKKVALVSRIGSLPKAPRRNLMNALPQSLVFVAANGLWDKERGREKGEKKLSRLYLSLSRLG